MAEVTFEHVEGLARKLPRDDRIRLVEVLVASLEPEIVLSPEWEEEIRRRIAEIDAGTAEMISGEEVMREMDDLIAGRTSAVGDDADRRRVLAGTDIPTSTAG